MWHIILIHLLCSKAESGVRFPIRHNPGRVRKTRNMFENGKMFENLKFSKLGLWNMYYGQILVLIRNPGSVFLFELTLILKSKW